jgi:quinol monooxygenase YgiN
MRFVQTVAFSTDRLDEMRALMDEFARTRAGEAPGFVKSTLVKDRDNDGKYLVIAEFESYEQAMENSARPETDAFARQMAELAGGPPSFGNYDVLSVQEP